MWHRSSNPQPHPAVLPHLWRFRRQTWPSPVDAHRKLWGPAETLRQTADFALLTGLKIYHGREHRRSQYASTNNCLSRYLPEIHCTYCWDIKQKQNQLHTPTLTGKSVSVEAVVGGAGAVVGGVVLVVHRVGQAQVGASTIMVAAGIASCTHQHNSSLQSRAAVFLVFVEELP